MGQIAFGLPIKTDPATYYAVSLKIRDYKLEPMSNTTLNIWGSWYKHKNSNLYISVPAVLQLHTLDLPHIHSHTLAQEQEYLLDSSHLPIDNYYVLYVSCKPETKNAEYHILHCQLKLNAEYYFPSPPHYTEKCTSAVAMRATPFQRPQ